MLVVFFTLLGLFVIGYALLRFFSQSIESELNDNPDTEQENDVKQPPKPKQPK